jgi:hypothetical protein
MAGPRLSFPRLQRRLDPEGEQVPMDELAAPIRDRLALQRQRLDALMPECLDRAAESLAALHGDLRGEITALAAVLGRSPRYLRGELDGSHGLPLEDLFALASLRPKAVAAAIELLSTAMGYRLEPLEPDKTGGVPVALAHVAREFGETTGGIITRLQDGLTGEEACECDGLLHELKQALAELEAALHDQAMGGRR